MIAIRIAAAIGSVALAGALTVPAAALASAATPNAPRAYRIQSTSDRMEIAAPDVDGPGDVTLAPSGDGSWFTIGRQQVYYVTGKTFSQYVDTFTHLCLQATTTDTMMAEGDCSSSPTTTRQYWFWNGQVFVNLAFQTKAYPDDGAVAMGTGGGVDYYWDIILAN
jgi:hypothetical protein